MRVNPGNGRRKGKSGKEQETLVIREITTTHVDRADRRARSRQVCVARKTRRAGRVRLAAEGESDATCKLATRGWKLAAALSPRAEIDFLSIHSAAQMSSFDNCCVIECTEYWRVRARQPSGEYFV